MSLQLKDGKLYLLVVLCMHFGATFGEFVHYRPILIQEYKDSHNISENEHFNVWMYIRSGIYPNISSVDKPVTIGSPLSILIYLDSQQDHDINVNECWAYNEQNYHISTMKVLLTNNVTKSQQDRRSALINTWKKIYPVTKQNVTTLLYTNTTAFQFPKNNYVYVACTVEICRESCHASLRTNNLLYGTHSEKLSQTTTPTPSIKLLFDKLKHSTAVHITTTPTTSTPPDYNCARKLTSCSTKETIPTYTTDFFRSIFSSKLSRDCEPEAEIDPRCVPVTPPNCSPGTHNPECHTTSESTSAHPDCRHGDKCETETPISSNLMYNPFLPPNCYPNSKDPRCKVIEHDKPLDHHSHGFLKPPNCYPGSKDVRCKDIL